MHETSLLPAIIPFVSTETIKSKPSIEKSLHVPGFGKNEIPVYHENPDTVESFKMQSSDLMTDLNNNIVPIKTVKLPAFSQDQQYQAFNGRNKLESTNFNLLNEDGSMTTQNSNGISAEAGEGMTIPDSASLHNFRHNYPTPLNVFSNDHAWRKTSPPFMKNISSYPGFFLRHRIGSTTVDPTPKSSWPSEPMKLTMRFRENPEGKIVKLEAVIKLQSEVCNFLYGKRDAGVFL